jgi:hypothetical protein
VDRRTRGRHTLRARLRARTRLAAGGGQPLHTLCTAVAADSGRAERTRVPLAGGRRRRQAQADAAAPRELAVRAGARPEYMGRRRGAGVRRAVTGWRTGRLREERRQHARRGDPRARRRDRAAASRPTARDVRRVPGVAARRIGFLLRGLSRAERCARGRGGVLGGRLRAPARLGRAGPPDLRRRPREGVLVLRRGQRVRTVRGALQVGLRPRQRRLPAARRRRGARAGRRRDALAQPRAGDRRSAADPHRPRRATRPSLRRAAERTDGVADAHRRRRGHVADCHRRGRPPLRRLLARSLAPRARPRRGRQLPPRPAATRARLGQSQRG